LCNFEFGERSMKMNIAPYIVETIRSFPTAHHALETRRIRFEYLSSKNGSREPGRD
jgi:hypothetical protein